MEEGRRRREERREGGREGGRERGEGTSSVTHEEVVSRQPWVEQVFSRLALEVEPPSPPSSSSSHTAMEPGWPAPWALLCSPPEGGRGRRREGGRWKVEGEGGEKGGREKGGREGGRREGGRWKVEGEGREGEGREGGRREGGRREGGRWKVEGEGREKGGREKGERREGGEGREKGGREGEGVGGGRMKGNSSAAYMYQQHNYIIGSCNQSVTSSSDPHLTTYWPQSYMHVHACTDKALGTTRL